MINDTPKASVPQIRKPFTKLSKNSGLLIDIEKKAKRCQSTASKRSATQTFTCR